MRKRMMAVLIASLTILMGTVSFAEVPDNAVVLGDKAYAVELLFSDDYTAQIQTDANAANGSLYYNLGAGWKNIFTNEEVIDFNSWPQIAYVDASGITHTYAAQNGEEATLSYEISDEIMFEEGYHYMTVTFNKDLLFRDDGYEDIVDDSLEGGTHQSLYVNGELTEAEIGAVDWGGDPNKVDELNPIYQDPKIIILYINSASSIPDGAEISFKFFDSDQYGRFIAEDGTQLTEDKLTVTKTVANEYYEEMTPP